MLGFRDEPAREHLIGAGRDAVPELGIGPFQQVAGDHVVRERSPAQPEFLAEIREGEATVEYLEGGRPMEIEAEMVVSRTAGPTAWP